MSDEPNNDQDQDFGHGQETDHETLFKGSYDKKDPAKKETENPTKIKRDKP